MRYSFHLLATVLGLGLTAAAHPISSPRSGIDQPRNMKSRATPDIDVELPQPFSIGARAIPDIEVGLPQPFAIGTRALADISQE